MTGNGPNTAGFPPTSAGDYRWIVTYSGDANNVGSSVGCNGADNTSTVAKDDPALSLSSSPSVQAGGKIRATAGLTSGFSPGGNVTVRTFGPGDPSCSGTPLATTTKAVTGNGNYDSDELTANDAGTYRFTASYGGDANNETAGAACGAPVVVTPREEPTPDPDPEPPAPDTTPPGLTVQIDPSQGLDRTLGMNVTCDEPCVVTAKGNLSTACGTTRARRRRRSRARAPACGTPRRASTRRCRSRRGASRRPRRPACCARRLRVCLDDAPGLGDDRGFLLLAPDVLVRQLPRQVARASPAIGVAARISSRSSGQVRRTHAAGRVQPRRQHEADVKAVERLAAQARIRRAALRARRRAGRATAPARPQLRDDAVLADERHDVGQRADRRDLDEVRQQLRPRPRARSSACTSFSATPTPASILSG